MPGSTRASIESEEAGRKSGFLFWIVAI